MAIHMKLNIMTFELPPELKIGLASQRSCGIISDNVQNMFWNQPSCTNDKNIPAKLYASGK
jgi:hypothetical protein